MTSKWWNKIQDLFEQALELPADERLDFIRERAEGDSALLDEVVSLIKAHEESEDLLDGSAFDILVPGKADEGQFFGPYKILEKIGVGGMGTVYLAQRADGSFDQQVAIKVVKRGMDSELVLERFRLERQVLARLEHPNIARLLDGGVTEDGRPFFVMEHVIGEPVTKYCDRLKLPLEERLRLFTHICKAVHHAHQNLVVHRDLKPGNILVTSEGVVKLLDFGIAKVLDESEDPSLTKTGQHILTPAYASPEQLTSADITTSSDVYSLGVILYELLAGRLPFEIKRTRDELKELVLSQDPERPSTAVLKTGESADLKEETRSPETVSQSRSTRIDKLRRQLSGDLDKICLMALRKEPERRYSSAQEFAMDLRRHMDGLTVYAQPDSLSYRTTKFLSRHRVGVATAVAVFIGFLTLVGFYTRQVERERDAALAEQAKTSEVVKFITGLFEYAAPDNSRGEDVTVQAILGEGARQIDTDLKGQPEIRSTLMRVLGEVYYEIGDREAADSLVGSALSIQDTLASVSLVEQATTQLVMGMIRQDEASLDAADSLFHKSLSIRLRERGNNHIDVAESKGAIGFLYETRGMFPEAESLYLETAQITQVLADNESTAAVADSYQMLAGLYRLTDRYDDAESYLRRALAVQLEVYGADHLEVAKTKRHLAAVLRDTDRFEESDSLYREVIEMRTRMLGPDHVEVGHTWNSYATLLSRMGDTEGAIEANKKMLSILEKNFDGPHPSFAAAYSNLAFMLQDIGDDEAAIEHFHRSIAVQDAVGLDPGHPNRAFPLMGLANTYRHQGNYSDAIRISRDVLALRREALTSEHRHTMDTASDLASSLIETGAYSEAEELLLEAHNYFAENRGMDDNRTQRTINRLVRLYEQLDNTEEASRFRAMLLESD